MGRRPRSRAALSKRTTSAAHLSVRPPPYPVLEIGAGSGLATQEIIAAGSEVTAIEPGARRGAILHATTGVQVLRTTLEDSTLDDGSFDAVAAATSMHWVDLAAGLPKLHAALRPGGRLAVWRTCLGTQRGPRSSVSG